MDGRWCNAEHGRCLLDGQQFAFGFFGTRLKARNVPMAAQVADAAGFELVTICSGAPLAIEDACDHSVGIELGQLVNERDCVLIGVYRCRPRTW